jgi:hypothetical protein
MSDRGIKEKSRGFARMNAERGEGETGKRGTGKGASDPICLFLQIRNPKSEFRILFRNSQFKIIV